MIGWQPWSSLNLRAQDIKPQIWWHDYKINHRSAAVPPSHALLDHTVMSHVKSASGTLESPDRDLPAKHKGSQRSLGALNRCSAYRYRQQCGLICRFECEGKHSSTGDPVRWGDTSIPTPAYHLSPRVTPKQSWDPLQENSQCLSASHKSSDSFSTREVKFHVPRTSFRNWRWSAKASTFDCHSIHIAPLLPLQLLVALTDHVVPSDWAQPHELSSCSPVSPSPRPDSRAKPS